MILRNKINGIKEIWQFDNRWQILLTRLLFSNEKINVYRYKGLEILVDHSAGDANGAREVLVSDAYRKHIKQMKLDAKVNVLDLGSNNGGFPLLLKSENVDIKKLVCVEFNPRTFSRLRFNLERNFSFDCFPLNLAVCGENRSITVGSGESSTSDSIYRTKDSTDASLQKVEGLTFNEIFNKHFANEVVDICKIDIEGAEFEVFENKGFDQIKRCRYILLEIHHEPDSPREIVREVLKGIGFEEIDGDAKSDQFHHVHFFVNSKL